MISHDSYDFIVFPELVQHALMPAKAYEELLHIMNGKETFYLRKYLGESCIRCCMPKASEPLCGLANR